MKRNGVESIGGTRIYATPSETRFGRKGNVTGVRLNTVEHSDMLEMQAICDRICQNTTEASVATVADAAGHYKRAMVEAERLHEMLRGCYMMKAGKAKRASEYSARKYASKKEGARA